MLVTHGANHARTSTRRQQPKTAYTIPNGARPKLRLVSHIR
jgi:hypothetical protein